MNILFIHRDLPGQFAPLIQFLAAKDGYTIYTIREQSDKNKLSSVNTFEYPAPQKNKHTHHYVCDLERSVRRAQAVVKILQHCQRQQIQFDLAITHTGWGEALYFKDIYPLTPLIGYAEFFYHTHDADVGFDPEFPVSLDFLLQVKSFNAQLLLGLNECDALISPTYWQKSLFPNAIQQQINVIHEGVDSNMVKANPCIEFTLPNGQCLTKKDKVVTYCARSLEPYRGFHIFIKAVELICQQHPDCYVLIVGMDKVSYNQPLANGQSYREKYTQGLCLPSERVFFLGTVSYTTHLQLLQLSSVHLYLTYPFVLSWSLMEAMASECVLIASATPPVLELIEDQKNGLLVDFFDDKAIAHQVHQIFIHPDRMAILGKNARKTIIHHYQRDFSLCRYQQLISSLIPDF